MSRLGARDEAASAVACEVARPGAWSLRAGGLGFLSLDLLGEIGLVEGREAGLHIGKRFVPWLDRFQSVGESCHGGLLGKKR